MATVCGTSLALMDAGVPLKAPVAGIAMGLIKEGDEFAVLSDILGDEDHLGDMDFKLPVRQKALPSLQMDIKIDGITEEIMKVALEQAKGGRLHILGEMSKALGEARAEVGEFAPRNRNAENCGRQDPCKLSVRAARLSAKSSRKLAPRSISATTAPSRLLLPMAQPSPQRSTGSIPLPLSQKLALSTKARLSKPLTLVPS